MSFITKKTWQNNGVEVIVFNKEKWLNKKHIEEQIRHSNLSYITRQYSLKFRKQRQ